MALVVTVPEQEFFNSETNEFYTVKSTTLKLEHSLVAVAKWESKWHIAFLDDKNEKTNEMMIDYIRCMTISQNVDPQIYYHLPSNVIQQINDYINNPMTATVVKDMHKQGGNRGEFVTNELIYYWMIAQNIPLECEKWHLNRLMTLIRVCSEKNTPSKKMNKRDVLNRNRALNEARKRASGSRG
jgi:hypothetical protein